MMCIEWWTFEICQFLSGQFGTTVRHTARSHISISLHQHDLTLFSYLSTSLQQLAAQIVAMQVCYFVYMIPLGMKYVIA
jgi:hypothetical protein